MAMQQRWHVTLLLLLLSLSRTLGDTTATPKEGNTFRHSILQEVLAIPSTGVSRLCVLPLDGNTRLKVQHTKAEGGRQEVVVKRKSLSKDTLNILEIAVNTDDALEPSLSVHLNGTLLQSLQKDVSIPVSPAPAQPRTALLLKGNAIITDCTEASEKRSGLSVEVLEEQRELEEVTEAQEGKEVIEAQGGEEVTKEQGGGDGVRSSSSSTMLLLVSANSVNTTTEDPESSEEDPWWSFLLVLGKVGEVPVLALLLGCLLAGAVLGSILVFLCSKVCKKRRAGYDPVPARRTRSGQLAVDVIRESKLWDSVSRQRSSGISSAYSTLNTDNGSHLGTTNSRGTGARPTGSANSSMDRSTRTTTHLGMNNLGKGTTGSPSSSMGRGHIDSSSNTLNIPNSNAVTRYGSNRSTGSSDNRNMDISPMLAQDNGVARSYSNRSTGSSINRNTNRSPNIPYTKTLGLFAGHQDISLMTKPINTHDDSDHDSDDPNYEKPYISPPIVAENYSIPHNSSTQPLLVELRTTTASSTNDPTNTRQIPVFHFETFKK